MEKTAELELYDYEDVLKPSCYADTAFEETVTADYPEYENLYAIPVAA